MSSRKRIRKVGKLKAVAPPAGPAHVGHLLLTLAIDRENGRATIYGNVESLADHGMMLECLGAAQAQLTEKVIALRVAAGQPGKK